MTTAKRHPQAFVLEDAKAQDSKQAKVQARPSVEIEFAPEAQDLSAVVVPATSSSAYAPRVRWSVVLAVALAVLAVMWAGLTVMQLVQAYFSQSAALGWITLGVATIAGVSVCAIAVREIWAFSRLRRLGTLQDAAAHAINFDNAQSATIATSQLMSLFHRRADLAVPLREFQNTATAIMDPRDRVMLADRILLTPLDTGARQIIARRARRVTLLTALTPAAALDVLFVAFQNLAMLREIASLYGGRPSSLSTLKLARLVVAHLAVAGGLALSDAVLQQLIGKGLLGRLSARFGEGAINGVMTARIGLAAIAVCRPIPQEPQIRSDLARLIKDVISPGDSQIPQG